MAKDCLLQVNGYGSGQSCWIYLNPDWNARNQGWFVSGSTGGFQPVPNATQGTIQHLPVQIQLNASGKLAGSLIPIDLGGLKVGERGFLRAGGAPYEYSVVDVDLHTASDTPHSLTARIQLSYSGQD